VGSPKFAPLIDRVFTGQLMQLSTTETERKSRD